MSLRDLALQGMETSINRVIALDPETPPRMARLHGRVIGIGLRGIGVTFYFVPEQSGRLQLLGSIEGEPDALIEGSPLDLMRASDKQHGSAQLFAGHVTLTGDTQVAQQFSEALGGLHIDWEELLSKLVGDVAAHEIGRAAQQAGDEGKRIGEIWQTNLSEYLTEEARLLPHRHEVEEWLSGVEHTRDDVERLLARVGLIERKQ